MNNQQGAALLVLMMILLTAASFMILEALPSNRLGLEQRQIAQTMTLLNEAREALIGFALANGQLPCPAAATTVSGAAGAGLAPAPGALGCANLAGVLPWATLGVSETDAWGNRFTYRVSQVFTDAAPTFTLSSVGDMGIGADSNVPAVVISHGKNGNGAYSMQGGQLALGADVDEQDNQLTGAGGASTANTTFVSKTATATFDDLASWLPYQPGAPFYQGMASIGTPP